MKRHLGEEYRLVRGDEMEEFKEDAKDRGGFQEELLAIMYSRPSLLVLSVLIEFTLFRHSAFRQVRAYHQLP